MQSRSGSSSIRYWAGPLGMTTRNPPTEMMCSEALALIAASLKQGESRHFQIALVGYWLNGRPYPSDGLAVNAANTPNFIATADAFPVTGSSRRRSLMPKLWQPAASAHRLALKWCACASTWRDATSGRSRSSSTVTNTIYSLIRRHDRTNKHAFSFSKNFIATHP